MSNKFMSWLIIFGFIAGAYLFYIYFYVYRLVNFNIVANVDNYKVVIESQRTFEKRGFECKEKECVLKNIPAFEYKLTAYKNGYIDISKKFNPSKIYKTDLNFEKNIVFEQTKDEVSKEINTKTRDNLINKFREEKDNYRVFTIDLLGDFYLKEKEGILALYKGDKQIGAFDMVDKNFIDLQRIYNCTDYIFLKLGSNKYIINLDYNTSYQITMDMDVGYMKKGLSDKEFHIVTDVGSFLYDIGDGRLDYFSKFRDFVYIDNAYVAIVDFDDKQRKINLGFESYNDSLIVYYNPKSKEKRILKTLADKFKKIFIENGVVYLITESGIKYKIENF